MPYIVQSNIRFLQNIIISFQVFFKSSLHNAWFNYNVLFLFDSKYFFKIFFHRCFSKIRNYNFILFQAQQFDVNLKANYSLSSVNVKRQLFQIFKELTERG